MDNNAMFRLSYGLFVLTAEQDGKQNGCICNTAIQAASEPNQISISVNKANLTHDMIRASGRFNVSVISQKADFELFRWFGFQSGKDMNKFEGFAGYAKAPNGVYYVTEGTNAYFSVDVEKTIDLGSHTMFIGRITEMEVLDEAESATYAYYHTSIKPQPAASDDENKGWRCKICGYVYEGEDLPADFICPLCKHPASDFERIS